MTQAVEPTIRMVARGGRLFYESSDGRVFPVVRGGDGPTVGLAELLQRAADLSTIESDDELAQLDADITAAAEALAGQDDLGDEDLALLEQAGERVQAIRAEQDSREAERQDRAARAQAALATIRGEDPEADPEPDPEADPAADPEVTDPEAADPPADPAADPEPADPEAQVPEPIAAAAPARRPVTRVAARRPAAAQPRTVAPAEGLRALSLTAAANAPGIQAGAPITSYDELAQVFIAAFNAARGYRHGPAVKVPVVRAAAEYPEHLQLGTDARLNMERIDRAQRFVREQGGIRNALAAAAGMDAPSLTAAGGICAPQQVRYDMPVLGTDARPVRDGFLTRFGADRGGISTLPIPLIDDVDSGAVDVWTEANDQNPSDPATKPCLTLTCPDPDETVVEAITRCLEFGNFRARYFPEQIEAWMRLVSTWHARFAEQRLLATIATGSTAVTSGQVLGTTRDVLAALDRAISVWRYRHRDDGIPLEFGAPIWLRDQMRTDLARQLPVGTVEETLAVADATIARLFASRQVDPVWFLDGESGQRFTVQGAGPLQGWPSTAKTYLAPAGSWLFLDGGTLDLGIVRDSTLNSTNDVQVFAETFEGAHFHGAESWTIEFDTCPDGSVSATVDINPCATGS